MALRYLVCRRRRRLNSRIVSWRTAMLAPEVMGSKDEQGTRRQASWRTAMLAPEVMGSKDEQGTRRQASRGGSTEERATPSQWWRSRRRASLRSSWPYTKVVIRELVRIATKAESDNARVLACKEVLDRGWGPADAAVPSLPEAAKGNGHGQPAHGEPAKPINLAVRAL
jgi:hypothetical protein